MSRFTEGEWKCSPLDEKNRYYWIRDISNREYWPEGQPISRVYWRKGDSDECGANARLITAAPAMFKTMDAELLDRAADFYQSFLDGRPMREASIIDVMECRNLAHQMRTIKAKIEE